MGVPDRICTAGFNGRTVNPQNKAVVTFMCQEGPEEQTKQIKCARAQVFEDLEDRKEDHPITILCYIINHLVAS